MAELPALDGDIEEFDGRGLCAIPGLVDCHTHPAFGGDRVEEFSRRAAGAGYEELHAAGLGILSTVGATRAAGEAGIAEAVHATATGCSGPGRRPSRESRATASTVRPSLRRCGRSQRQGDPDLSRSARHSAQVRGRRCLSRLHSGRRTPGCGTARRGRGRLPRARRLRRHTGSSLPGGVPLARPGVEAARRPVHGGGRDPARDRARRAVGRPPRGDRPGGVAALAESDVAGVLLPASALFLCATDAARPRARRRRRCNRARDRLQPRQRVLREPPARLLARATQLKLSPAEALAACTVNAAHVLGRGDTLGRLAPGYVADVTLLDAPDWRYLAYHLGGDIVAAVVKDGNVAFSRSAY